CAPRAGNSCLISARRRAALAMGIPALAFAGGGVAALAVGVRQQRQLAATAAVLRSDRRTTGAVFVVSGRF
ncbi:MAG: hypothetical protein AAF721_33650, partial [Myxococcota bacterium]